MKQQRPAQVYFETASVLEIFVVRVLTAYCFMNAIWLIIRLPPCFVWVLRTIFPSFVSSRMMNSFTHRSFPF